MPLDNTVYLPNTMKLIKIFSLKCIKYKHYKKYFCLLVSMYSCLVICKENK